MRKSAIYLLAALLFGGCATPSKADDDVLYVSILPLRSIVGAIVGSDFRVEVLVPPGASPETFEPTARQFAALSRARMIFSVGLLDFEHALLGKVTAPERIVNLSQGIDIIAGSCAHNHAATPAKAATNSPTATEAAPEAHAHGIDPHIWTSPRGLLTMANNAYRALHREFPDSTKYTAAYERLAAELRALDASTAECIAASGVKHFIIYHPALTYYARDYGLQQIAVEADGKEPSARYLSQIIGQARRDGVRQILFQSQFPASSVEVIASDIGAEVVEIDPLREDAAANIAHITSIITR